MIKNNSTSVNDSLLKLIVLMTRSSPFVVSYALTDFPSLCLCSELGVISSSKSVPGMKHCLAETSVHAIQWEARKDDIEMKKAAGKAPEKWFEERKQMGIFAYRVSFKIVSK